MSLNLIDLAKGYLTDAVMDKASSFLGESPEKTSAGFASAIPAILGGLISRSSDTSGAAKIFDLLKSPEIGGGMLENLGSMFGRDSSKSLGLGESLLSTIFGDKKGNITELIASMSGMKSGSASSLLKFAAPFLMSIVGKQVKEKGLGLSGLMSMLGDQKQFLQKEAPAGLLDSLGGMFDLGGIGAAASGISRSMGNAAGGMKSTAGQTLQRSAAAASGAAKNATSSTRKWVLPVLVIGLAAIAAWYFLRGDAAENLVDAGKGAIESTTNAVKDAADAGAAQVKNIANAAVQVSEELIGQTVEGLEDLGKWGKKMLPGGSELIIPEKGFEAQLLNAITTTTGTPDDAWFNFDRVLFETGSATLLSESMSQIENTASILKAYPNVNIKIGGYTDNTGSPEGNKTLSQARAEVVMRAIIGQGISADRLAAEGYGQEHPVATNDTPEGRQQNRRVAVKVTAK